MFSFIVRRVRVVKAFRSEGQPRPNCDGLVYKIERRASKASQFYPKNEKIYLHCWLRFSSLFNLVVNWKWLRTLPSFKGLTRSSSLNDSFVLPDTKGA